MAIFHSYLNLPEGNKHRLRSERTAEAGTGAGTWIVRAAAAQLSFFRYWRDTGRFQWDPNGAMPIMSMSCLSCF